jgi:hypothetical protein
MKKIITVKFYHRSPNPLDEYVIIGKSFTDPKKAIKYASNFVNKYKDKYSNRHYTYSLETSILSNSVKAEKIHPSMKEGR